MFCFCFFIKVICDGSPEKMVLDENLPRKIFPRRIATRKNAPPPLFAPVKIVLQLFLFKFFIVTSFKGVSSTLALSIMDLLLDSILDVAVVVDLPLPLRFASNKLVEFIRYRFSKAYISNNYRKDVISNE